MTRFRFLAFFMVLLLLSSSSFSQKWDKDKANQWIEKFPWLCGVNYIPAYAVNYTAMWDRSTFDPKAIGAELDLMKDLGMNCVRVVLQYAVYEDNSRAFLKNFEKFLSICSDRGIIVMPIFFDDCVFGVNNNPKAGRQPEPLEGWYAWNWSPSPGISMVVDEREHYKLEAYVKDIMSKYKDDNRILLWDLYNEPTNNPHGQYSYPLLNKVFKWAREINPSQPLSVAFWNDNKQLNDIISDNSDVVTFHWYGDKESTKWKISTFKVSGRPIICTEWMNRNNNCTIKEVLPVYRENNVGCFSWGLVNGKTQTHLCWGHKPENLPYTKQWQHDIFHGDFTPYNKEEVEIIKQTIGNE